jgi:hypothetical protein
MPLFFDYQQCEMATQNTGAAKWLPKFHKLALPSRCMVKLALVLAQAG